MSDPNAAPATQYQTPEGSWTYQEIAEWLNNGDNDSEIAKTITYRELKTACMCRQIEENVELPNAKLAEIFAFCMLYPDYAIASTPVAILLASSQGSLQIPANVPGSLSARDGDFYYVPPRNSSSHSGGSSGNNNNNNNNNNG